MIKNKTAVILSFVIILLIVLATLWHKKSAPLVVIQAGHEGRTKGNTGSSYSRLKEVDWNIYVANEAARKLREWGISVKRVGADTKVIKAKVAVAIHFDGAPKPCSSGASIGYQNRDSKEFANRWKKLYKSYYPFKWQKDNFTENLSKYYGYNYIKADKFLVLELGEITCKKQTKWLKPRLKTIAHLVAANIAREFGLDARVKLK